MSIKALLLTAPGCPHCAGVKQALEQLQSEGIDVDIEVVNIADQPDVAMQFGARSVPWLLLDQFEFAGSWSVGELRHWARLAGNDDGMTEYLASMLSSGNLVTAERVIRRNPQTMTKLLPLIVDNERDINVHIGISALLEGMQGESLLIENMQDIAALLENDQARVRADACHYLMLTGDKQAAAYIKPLCEDSDPEVREIAKESLQELLEGNA